MAKTKEVVREVAPKKKKTKYFPKFEMLIGVLAVAAGVVHYLNLYELPIFVFDLMLILSGLLLFYVGLRAGFYRKRKERLLRHL